MNLNFLSGNGELAQKIREKNWTGHELGPLDQWPQSLKTMVGVMLANKFPTYIIWGPDFVQLYNDAYIAILGTERHPQALGEKSEITWPDIWTTIGPMYQKVVDSGEPIGFDNYFLPRLRNGVLTNAYYSFSYNPIWDESGRVGGIAVICKETTDQVLLEATMKANNEVAAQMEEILEGMSDGFFAVDKDWTIFRVNAQFENIVTMKREEVIGKNFLKVFLDSPEHQKSKYYQCYTNVMTNRVPDSFVDYYEPLNIWTAVNVYPTASGGMAAFFHEISEERRSAQKLQEAISARDTFLSIASHELRTPITSLKLHNQILERKLERAKDLDLASILKFVHKNGSGLERMNRLVEDMLDISRIQHGKLHMEFSDYDLVTLIRDIFDKYSEQLVQVGIDVKILSDKESSPIRVDVQRMEQVFVNLITNAIRYAPQKPVEVSVTELPDSFEIIFRDFGQGISEGNHERVFDRFERVVNANEVSGLGLGLYIVREIIQGHGGTIHLEKGMAVGAKFIIKLPKEFEAL